MLQSELEVGINQQPMGLPIPKPNKITWVELNHENELDLDLYVSNHFIMVYLWDMDKSPKLKATCQ